MPHSTYNNLVDENTNLDIGSDYDPLMKNTFERYIHITEKANLGCRFFHNIADKETQDIHVWRMANTTFSLQEVRKQIGGLLKTLLLGGPFIMRLRKLLTIVDSQMMNLLLLTKQY